MKNRRKSPKQTYTQASLNKQLFMETFEKVRELRSK